MIKKILKVNLVYGLHARPSSHIVSKLTPLKLDKAEISCKNKTADLKSILSLLTLFVQPGDEVEVELSGANEKEALKIIEDVFNEKENDSIYKGVP